MEGLGFFSGQRMLSFGEACLPRRKREQVKASPGGPSGREAPQEDLSAFAVFDPTRPRARALESGAVEEFLHLGRVVDELMARRTRVARRAMLLENFQKSLEGRDSHFRVPR